MKRTRAAIVAAAGVVLGVLTLRVLRNRGPEADATADGMDDATTDATDGASTAGDSPSASGTGEEVKPASAGERTPRIRPTGHDRNRSAGDPDGTPRIRSEGPDRRPVPADVERTPRIRPRDPARKPRLRKVGKGWLRR